jgi:hypothetical protein
VLLPSSGSKSKQEGELVVYNTGFTWRKVGPMPYETAGKKGAGKMTSEMSLLISAAILDQELKVACNGSGSTLGTNDLMVWIKADVEASCAIP